jgi:hypothetical protein
MKTKTGPWDTDLIDDDFDETSVVDIVNTSRGERRSEARRGGDYRRPNRFVEDGYGELDFA